MLMWTGNKVKPGVPASPYARRQGEGFAVWVGEEDNVSAIVSHRAAKKLSARLLNETPEAHTGGFFRVKLNDQWDWEVA